MKDSSMLSLHLLIRQSQLSGTRANVYVGLAIVWSCCYTLLSSILYFVNVVHDNELLRSPS